MVDVICCQVLLKKKLTNGVFFCTVLVISIVFGLLISTRRKPIDWWGTEKCYASHPRDESVILVMMLSLVQKRLYTPMHLLIFDT